MTLVAAAGLVLVVFTSGPGCSAEQAPTFTLPSPSSPDIVALAAQNPAEALKVLESRRGSTSSIETHVLRARLLADGGRHAESAGAWDAVAVAEPSLRMFALRASVRASLAAGDVDRARSTLDQLLGEGAPTEHTDLALLVAAKLRIARRHDEA